MTQGRIPGTPELLNASRKFCDDVLPENSIYRLLYRESHRLFPDDAFSDLYSSRGRQSVPVQVLAVCTVLQRLEGLSDREAAERFMFDARWKYAAGGLSPDYPGFVHSVLVGFRARLRESDRPDRIFEAVLEVAKAAGLVGHRRALDSTPLYDAVATQDTVTMIRAAIRGVLRVCDKELQARVRGVLVRDDAYDTPGKPVCDWNDAQAREELIDALAKDGQAVLAFFDNEPAAGELEQALTLLATVLGQDLEQNGDGLFRIARRVAKDRVISTVDPQARHGHKTQSRGFDGYKGHVAVDPDSEIITATAVTPGNAGDASVADALLADVLAPPDDEPPGDADSTPPTSHETGPADAGRERTSAAGEEPEHAALGAAKNSLARVVGRWKHLLLGLAALMGWGLTRRGEQDASTPVQARSMLVPGFEVYGDASYGAAIVLARLEAAGVEIYTKVAEATAGPGLFPQRAFEIDLEAGHVRCPAGVTVELKRRGDGSSHARFGVRCASCPLREQCTRSKEGRTLSVHAHHELLERHREHQRAPDWKQKYRENRPKVERKIGHLMRRKHGGRRARVRGTERVGQDFSLLAAAANLARLSQLAVQFADGAWSTAGAQAN
jgi:transposase